MNTLQAIQEILYEYSLTGGDVTGRPLPLVERIGSLIERHAPLTFILPAFPAKSPSREKTNGELPDLGEVLALRHLQNFCERISRLYAPGAELIICSDGRVFSDVVDVPDASIDRYNDGIVTIIREYDLHHLRVFGMEDLYPGRTPAELRALLIDVYAEDPEEVRARVHARDDQKKLFNGIHRFLYEDEIARADGRSRSAARKSCKEKTYELLRRSDAWSNLLKAHFPDTLRLSIHPHALGHEKFGIKLVPSSDKWATPWHNVVVKIAGRFELMHRRRALELNAKLKMEREKYAYFEVTAI